MVKADGSDINDGGLVFIQYKWMLNIFDMRNKSLIERKRNGRVLVNIGLDREDSSSSANHPPK